MELQETLRRINLIKKHYPNSIILRSPLSWNNNSDIDLLINLNQGLNSDDYSTIHEGVKFDLFIDSNSAKSIELISCENIQGIKILDPGLEKIIFILKDLFHLGKLRKDKYIYYSKIKSDNSIIKDKFLRFIVNNINNKNYYLLKILTKLYAEVHLFIRSRRFWKNSHSIRNKKIISRYDFNSI